jgi:hypothetical protein
MITQHALVINISDKLEVAIGEKVGLGTVAGEEAGDGHFLQICGHGSGNFDSYLEIVEGIALRSEKSRFVIVSSVNS